MTVLHPDTDLVSAIVAGLFGLLAGSFANVVIHRVPLEQSIVFPPSRCPRCQAALKPWQNIPLISWLLLRGRCANCREPISARYPFVEALHGAGFAAIALRYGVTPFAPALMAFFSALCILAFIDWDHQILPDVITLPGIALAVAFTFLPGSLVTWKEALVAAVIGYGGFFAVAEGYSRLRGIEGLGQGDWKLAAMMGSVLGGRRLLLAILLASISGTIFGLVQALRQRRNPEPSQFADETPAAVSPDLAPEVLAASEPAPHAADAEVGPPGPSPIGQHRLPFGTFLAAAAVFVLFFGDETLDWYSSLFRF